MDKMDNSIKEYINTLSDKQKKAMNIAKDHLQSSFNISKSVGYVEYKKKKEEKKI
jgi:hypothetical protein